MPSEDTQFKPGKSGNPGGRPALPSDLKSAKNMNRAEFEKVLNRFIGMTRAGIKEVMSNPEATALELILATVIIKAAEGGDHYRLNFLLDRLIGKVAERVDVDGKIQHYSTVTLLDGRKIELTSIFEKEEGNS